MKWITLDAERPAVLPLNSMVNLAGRIFIADDFHHDSKVGFAGKTENKRRASGAAELLAGTSRESRLTEAQASLAKVHGFIY
jgi:hypothetical protein